MKLLYFILILSTVPGITNAQKEFIGMASYRLTVVGADQKSEDSMNIVFDRGRLKIMLHMADQEHPGAMYTSTIIEDFTNKTEYVVDEQTKTYKADTFIYLSGLHFHDTNKPDIINGIKCTKFMADTASIDKAIMRNAGCMVSQEHLKSGISEFVFMNMQPVIINNRLVIDFLAEDNDGLQPRIYIQNLTELPSVEAYFSLAGYKEVK